MRSRGIKSTTKYFTKRASLNRANRPKIGRESERENRPKLAISLGRPNPGFLPENQV